MVEHPGMWAGILSLFRVGTVAGLMRILPMNRLGAGKHEVRAGLGKRIEYRKGANDSTSELAHNNGACDELLWRGSWAALCRSCRVQRGCDLVPDN